MFHLIYFWYPFRCEEICLDFKTENSFELRNKIFRIAAILEGHNKVLKTFFNLLFGASFNVLLRSILVLMTHHFPMEKKKTA